MIFGVEKTAIETHGAENLLRGLLQVICGQDVGRIGEETPCSVEIEVHGIEELAMGLFLRRASASIDDVTFARNSLRELT